jgi:hypothetical protein
MHCIGFFVGERFLNRQTASMTQLLTLYIKKQKHSQQQLTTNRQQKSFSDSKTGATLGFIL